MAAPLTPNHYSDVSAHNSVTPLIDADIILNQKENIQPLASGRRATELAGVITATPKLRQQEQSAARARFEQGLVDADDEDDPLDAWKRYVDWTTENYPQGASLQSGIIELLERATRTFKDDDRYKTDIRYMKMWLQYASHCERPVDIYAFMLANEIGTVHAAFYEEYCTILERDGRRTEADEMYLLGIRRKIRGVERLRQRHRDFKIRMMAGPVHETTAPPNQERQALGDVNPTPRSRNPRDPFSSINNGIGIPQATGPCTGNGSRLQVYVEDGEERADGNEWRELDTREAARKENSRTPVPAQGQKLKQKIYFPQTPRVDVYVDETSGTTPAGPPRNDVFALSTKTSGAQALMRNPFLHYTDQAPDSQSKASKSSMLPPQATPQTTSLPPPIPGKKAEKLHINIEMLKREGVEYSVAEVRARSLGLLGKKWAQAPARAGHTVNVAFESRPTLTGRSTMSMTGEPTVTINTKEALQDVYGMYNSPTKSRQITTQEIERAACQSMSRMMEIQGGGVPPTPTPAQGARRLQCDENAVSMGFRPFMDENTPGPKQASRSENSFKTPSTSSVFKPRTEERRALGAKTPLAAKRSSKEYDFPEKEAGRDQDDYEEVDDQIATNPGSIFRPKPPALVPFVDEPDEIISSNQIFIPARKVERDLFNSDREELKSPTPLPGKSFRPLFESIPSQSKPTFQPFTDHEDAAPLGRSIKSKPTYTPIVDEPPLLSKKLAFTPFLDENDGEDTSFSDDHPSSKHSGAAMRPGHSHRSGFELPPPQQFEDSGEEAIQGEENDEFDDEYQEYVPMGGRLGHINVMTPITERTYEFTGRVFTPFEQVTSDNEPLLGKNGLFAENLSEYAMEWKGGRTANSFDSDVSQNPITQLPENSNLATAIANEPLGDQGFPSGSDSDSRQPVSSSLLPCNPYDERLTSGFISDLPSDPSHYDFGDKCANQLEHLQRFAKKRARRGSTSSSGGNSSRDDFYPLVLGSNEFEVREKIGEGGFGAVFVAAQLLPDDVMDEECLVAIKAVRPGTVWESYALRHIQSKLDHRLQASIITPRALYSFKDESFLILDYSQQGTLLDAVNRASKAGYNQLGSSGMDELLVMFFSIELLRVVEGMHELGFIHGDLKIDNCMLRLDDVHGGPSAWATLYDPLGRGGWDQKGIRIIDFGRAIDTRLFPEGQEFIADWDTDEKDCFEMREDMSWTYQTDYFGLASIIYCMLFGKYLETTPIPSSTTSNERPRYKIATPFKRYWQGDLWSRVFDVLLNPNCVQNGALPIPAELARLRMEMESWVRSNCNKGKSLRGLLKKVESAVFN